MILRIALDGTLARGDMAGGPLILRDGAREGVLSLFRAGHELILRTARIGPDANRFPDEDVRAFLRREGLLGCFTTIESERYADLDLALRVEHAGAFDFPWRSIADAYGDGRAAAGDVGDSEWPVLRLWRYVGTAEYVIVDGPAVRNNPKMRGQRNNIKGPWDYEKIPFAEGGNESHYKFVISPPGRRRYWLDSANGWEEQIDIAVHETVEDAGMLAGHDYTTEDDTGAHDCASTAETYCRANPREALRVLREAVNCMEAALAGDFKPWHKRFGRAA